MNASNIHVLTLFLSKALNYFFMNYVDNICTLCSTKTSVLFIKNYFQICSTNYHQFLFF